MCAWARETIQRMNMSFLTNDTVLCALHSLYLLVLIAFTVIPASGGFTLTM
jgi:hypothetical protein